MSESETIGRPHPVLNYLPQGLAVFGAVSLAGGVAPVVPVVARHLNDPLVNVPLSVPTYASEVFVQVDYVGPTATAYAWLGACALLVACLMLVARRGGSDA